MNKELPGISEELAKLLIKRFNNAHLAVAFAHEVTREWPVPCFNEFRYAGRHLLDFFCGKAHDEEDLHRAARHLERAKKDAVQYALLRMGQAYKQCASDYLCGALGWDDAIQKVHDSARELWHQLPRLATSKEIVREDGTRVSFDGDVELWSVSAQTLLSPIVEFRKLVYERRFMSFSCLPMPKLEALFIEPSQVEEIDVKGLKQIYDAYSKLETAIAQGGVVAGKMPQEGHIYAGIAGLLVVAYVVKALEGNGVVLPKDEIIKYCGKAYFEVQVSILAFLLKEADEVLKRFTGKEYLFEKIAEPGGWRYNSMMKDRAAEVLKAALRTRSIGFDDYAHERLRTETDRVIDDLGAFLNRVYTNGSVLGSELDTLVVKEQRAELEQEQANRMLELQEVSAKAAKYAKFGAWSAGFAFVSLLITLASLYYAYLAECRASQQDVPKTPPASSTQQVDEESVSSQTGPGE